MFDILTKGKKKPFIISREFAKEIIESRSTKEQQEEMKDMAKTFEENNLKRAKVKRR